jgi:chromosome segregation ATPase
MPLTPELIQYIQQTETEAEHYQELCSLYITAAEDAEQRATIKEQQLQKYRSKHGEQNMAILTSKHELQQVKTRLSQQNEAVEQRDMQIQRLEAELQSKTEQLDKLALKFMDYNTIVKEANARAAKAEATLAATRKSGHMIAEKLSLAGKKIEVVEADARRFHTLAKHYKNLFGKKLQIQ